MNKEYYKEYYKLERTHWWFKVRELIILERLEKILPLGKNIEILNIGAATGRSSEYLRQFGNVTTIEYDKDCYEFLLDVLTEPVINASILDLPLENKKFDLVCAFDVIEHVEDDKQAILEMKRVCKPGGIVAITVPALMQLWSNHDIINHHFRRYVLKEVNSLFKEQKGQCIYKSYFNSILFFPIFLFRLITKISPFKNKLNGSGSDFSAINENNFLNRIFYAIFNVEKILLRKFRFGIGVSIFYIWQKDNIL